MTLSPFEAVFSSLSPDHRSNRVDQASGKIDPAYKAVRPLDRNFPAGPRRSNFYSVGSFDVLDRFA
jgi:hypothetical protein